MPEIDVQLMDLIKTSGWGNSNIFPLRSDASLRRYFRLKRNSETVILMDARLTNKKETDYFYKISAYLISHNFRCPKVYFYNRDKGIMIIEDFGNNLFSRVLLKDPQRSKELYLLATDTLISLRKVPLPDWLTETQNIELCQNLSPFFDFFLPKYPEFLWMKDTIIQSIKRKLDANLGKNKNVICLRDCHFENLILIPKERGPKSVGIIDFQDASLMHPAYDLVSILQDARCEVPLETETTLLRYYMKRTEVNSTQFLKAYRILGLQRNLRILGVFYKLSISNDKKRYMAYVPRVISYIERHLIKTLENKTADMFQEMFNVVKIKLNQG